MYIYHRLFQGAKHRNLCTCTYTFVGQTKRNILKLMGLKYVHLYAFESKDVTFFFVLKKIIQPASTAIFIGWEYSILKKHQFLFEIRKYYQYQRRVCNRTNKLPWYDHFNLSLAADRVFRFSSALLKIVYFCCSCLCCVHFCLM